MDAKTPTILEGDTLEKGGTNGMPNTWSMQNWKADPFKRCALVVLLGFIFFIAEGIAAVLVHNREILIVSCALHGTLLAVLIFFVGITIFVNRRRSPPYNPNLANTIATCIITIAICMVIYPFHWYPSLRRDTLQEQVQDMKAFSPPALAWISVDDRNGAANLLPDPWPKGFLSDITAGFDENMADCRDLTPDEVLASHYCNCSEMFTPLQRASLLKHDDGISYRTFLATPAIMINSTNTTLVLQVFSNHNSSTIPPGWLLPGPMLLLMAYDPSIPAEEAFTSGLAPVTQIPVLGSTTVVLTPQYRVGWNREPYYYYGMKTTSIPDLNDVCDAAVNPEKYCFTGTIVQFADMTRVVMTRTKELSPGDVFAQVGGYFALVQLLCWIVSGMALW